MKRPLSVDALVWPSVFEASDEWRGPVQDLWDDLERMDEKLQALPRAPRWRIAVAWVSEEDAGRSAVSPSVPQTRPDVPGDGWSILGYDVADGMLLSGLSNCGYDPSERAIFRRDWAGELNEHHLFENPAIARAFREATDTRVTEHAPFFVYCLMRIDDAEA